MMKIVVTGANGFIGKNLLSELNNKGYTEIFKYTRETSMLDLEKYIENCDFIFHLAGVNRPQDDKEFMEGNFELTENIISLLKSKKKKVPVLITSSIQAERNNPYGISKKAGENILLQYASETGAKVYVYRLPNVFGKWSRPNYNSVVSTFCYNVARGLDIQVHDAEAELHLCYIDDVVAEFIRALEGKSTCDGEFCKIPIKYSIKLGKLAEMIYGFYESRTNLTIINMQDELMKKLYSTYLSYLPERKFSYPLRMNIDHRGSFTEFIKTVDRGQVSVNISKPGITKGNHWHHTKNEKFLVVSGEGIIRFRKIGESEVIEYRVSGKNLEVVDIPVGYTHNIENIGDDDMVTIMWANECYDPEMPDTYFLEV